MHVCIGREEAVVDEGGCVGEYMTAKVRLMWRSVAGVTYRNIIYTVLDELKIQYRDVGNDRRS